MKKTLMEFVDRQYIYLEEYISRRNLNQALRCYHMAEGGPRVLL